MHARIVLLAVTAIVFCLSDTASASLMRGDIIQLSRNLPAGGTTSGHANGGGEFALYKRLANGSLTYVGTTFCIEYDEHIQLNRDIVIGELSDRAVLGGANTNNSDILDDRTKFLYSSYATDSLGASGFVAGDDDWANALQRALWYIEGEVGTLTTKAQQLYDYAEDNADAGTAGGEVFALNLFKSNTPQQYLDAFDPLNPSTWTNLASYHRQDQLWYVKTVPEPSTMLVWSMMAGIGFAFTNRRKKLSAA